MFKSFDLSTIDALISLCEELQKDEVKLMDNAASMAHDSDYADNSEYWLDRMKYHDACEDGIITVKLQLKMLRDAENIRINYLH